MKLIIVNRSSPETYDRLRRTFADDLNVEVIWERRVKQVRRKPDLHFPDRRQRQRRRLEKSWNGRDYIVIYIAEQKAS